MSGGQFLSMPDPCPHVSRMALIGAKLQGGWRLAALQGHIEACRAGGDVEADNLQFDQDEWSR